MLSLDAVAVPSTWLPDVSSPFWLSAAIAGVDVSPGVAAAELPGEPALSLRRLEPPRGARARGAWAKADGTARGRVGQQRPDSWRNPKWELRVARGGGSGAPADAGSADAGVADAGLADVHVFLAQLPPAGYARDVGELPRFHGVAVYVIDGYGALRELREHDGCKMAAKMVGGPDGNFSNYGEISAVRQLRPREEPYILMPATFGKSAKEEEGEFFLEVQADGPALSLARVAVEPADWPEDSRPASEYASAVDGGKRKGSASKGGNGKAAASTAAKAGGAKTRKKGAQKATTMSMSAAGEEVKGLGDMFAGLE